MLALLTAILVSGSNQTDLHEMLSTTTSTVEVRDQDQLVAIPSTIKLPDGKNGDKVAAFLHYLQVLTSLTYERRVLRHWINIHWTKLRQLIGK